MSDKLKDLRDAADAAYRNVSREGPAWSALQPDYSPAYIAARLEYQAELVRRGMLDPRLAGA